MDKINLVKQQKQLRYIAVYDKLFKMINEGTFPEGSQLPSEPELAKLIGVSRTTLRQSLALLQDDGLIKNVHGKGNFITKNSNNKNSGLEYIGNPIYKCCDEEIDDVEMDFHIEPPTDYMKQVLKRNTAVVVVVDRWYKSKDNVVAYAFSLIPIETISEFDINLNNNNELLNFLEKKIYTNCKNTLLEIKFTASSSFSTKKYSFSSKGSCYLLQESIYTDTDFPIIFNKNYLPLEHSTIKINPITPRK